MGVQGTDSFSVLPLNVEWIAVTADGTNCIIVEPGTRPPQPPPIHSHTRTHIHEIVE